MYANGHPTRTEISACRRRCLGAHMCAVSELTRAMAGVAMCSLKMIYIDSQGRFQSEKSRGAMAPVKRENRGDLELKPPAILLRPRPFCFKKTPYFNTEIGTYTRKSCKNEGEKAK